MFVKDYPLKAEQLKYNVLYRKGYSHGPVKRTMAWALPRIVISTDDIIDLGCGNATARQWFPNCNSYRGIDLSDYQITKLLAKDNLPNHEFSVGNLCSLVEYKDNQFDLGICIDVLEHIPPEFVSKAIKEICRICKNLIISISLIKEKANISHDGSDLHLCIKPAKWWIDLFKEHIKVGDTGSAGEGNLVLVAGPESTARDYDTGFEDAAKANGRLLLDGTMMIPRRNIEKEKIFDKLYMRLPGELRWEPRIAYKYNINAFPQAAGPIIIIGKGPSLDDLTASFFDDMPKAPVVCINESIFKVEYLRINNPIYLIQHDSIDCCPKLKSTIPILEHDARNWYPHIQTRYIYRKNDLGLPTPLTVLAAVHLAVKYMGANRLFMVAFDACTNGNTDYAAIVGYNVKPLSNGTMGERFLKHHDLIIEVANGLPLSWVTPNLDGSVSYIPQPLLSNPVEHHEPVPKESVFLSPASLDLPS